MKGRYDRLHMKLMENMSGEPLGKADTWKNDEMGR